MTLWIALFAAALAGSDPCDRSDDEQAAFTAGLETLHEQVKDSQLRAAMGAKDQSKQSTKLMLKYRKGGELCTPDDRFWATMNLLQSREQSAVDVAYEMAQELMEERHPRGPWVTGLAYDRWSIAYGRLQSYGTQTAPNGSKLCLVWVDTRFTDEDRKKYGHLPLKDSIARVLTANGVTGAEPTILALKQRDMWCKPEPWDGSRSDLRDPYDGR